MRVGFFNISLFKKYRSGIEERNRKGVIAAGFIFLGTCLLTIIAEIVLHVKITMWYMPVFIVLCIAGMTAVKLFYGRVRYVVNYVALLWYVCGIFIAAHIVYSFDSSHRLVYYALMSVTLALTIITEPVVLMIAQVLCAAGAIGMEFLLNNETRAVEPARITIICLIAIVAGLVNTFIRLENIEFEAELIDFSELTDDDFVIGRDSKWDGRNKYGLLSGGVLGYRRVFSFIVDATKEQLIKIRSDNIFGLVEGENWDISKSKIVSKVLLERDRINIEQFLSVRSMIFNCREGRHNTSALVAIKLDENEKIWLDMECIVRNHPLTGAVIATITVEDVTENRIMMGVFNQLLSLNYDCDICFDRKRESSTIQFRVQDGGEAYGVYGPGYNELIEKYINEQVSPPDRERFRKAADLKHVLEEITKNRTYSFIVDETAENGTTRKKLFQYAFLGNYHSFVNMTKQDITDVIAKETANRNELEQALREKEKAINARSEFMTRMSHEMRTPMNAILGLTNLIGDEINNPEALSEYIKKIEYSGKFLLQLINDVLDVSSIEHDKFKLHLESYSFEELWEATNMMITPLCRNKNVDFDWRSYLPDNIFIKTDKLRMTQVFVNLLTNAIKYTPEGGHIVFESREISRDGNKTHCRFDVIDDGIGMSEEFQKHLFEPFSQESKLVDSSLSGTGLGLSVVKAIVESMGGEISVSSSRSKGSTFTVMLTFEIAGEGPKIKALPENYDLTGTRILVVEDNDINREIAVAVLEKKGIVTETAVNGQEAVRMFVNSPVGYYELILMDIRMPVMDGLTATRNIRGLERGDAKTVPILAMTANAMEEDVQASEKAGLNDHLSKPVEPKILYETIAAYVLK